MLAGRMTPREHGTYTKYVTEHCRCDACRAANRDYERARNRRVTPAYVGASEARAHLRDLAGAGVGPRSVAIASGLSQSTLGKIIYGEPSRGRGPSKRIRRETHEAVLSVRPEDGPDGSRMPAGPAWDIVGELLGLGWRKADIGRALHGPHAKSLQIARESVSRKNYRALRALLDQLVPPKNRVDGPADDALPILARGDTSWMPRGACRRPEVPTWLFFPTRGDRETQKHAQSVCAACPVVEECGEYGQAHDLLGIWGGFSRLERDERRENAA